MSKTLKSLTWTVQSGKFDDGERNYKYINNFGTLEEAIIEWEINASYPFNEIVLDMTYDDGSRLFIDVTPGSAKTLGPKGVKLPVF